MKIINNIIIDLKNFLMFQINVKMNLKYYFKKKKN